MRGVFPPARRGRGDRLPTADAPFAILNPRDRRQQLGHSFYHGFMLPLRLCGLDDRPGYLDVVGHL